MQTTQTLTWVTSRCSVCGITMALTSDYSAARMADRKTFYCPNGHRQYYPGKTADEQIAAAERQAEFARARTRAVQDQLQSTQRSLAATKGVLTKTRKRIGNGVCPCCNRHFVNVERHMKGQHPDYQTED